MTIAKAITDFADVLEGAKVELAVINGRIEEREAEKLRLINTLPHTDDIVATFMRGLDATVDDFTRQMRTHLNETFAGSGAATAIGAGKSAQLLTLEPHKPDQETVLTRSMRGHMPDLNQAALTYFLRDGIKAEIPALVERLCPAAQSGMRQVDRADALQKVEGELIILREEAHSLQASLLAARAAVAR